MKRLLARWMRRYADRIDHAGAPKCTEMTFTIEPGRGIVVHGARSVEPDRPGHHRPGCKLWYLNDDEYMKAHTEVVDQTAWIDPDTGQWRGVAR